MNFLTRRLFAAAPLLLAACGSTEPVPPPSAGPIQVDATGILGGGTEEGLSPEDLALRVERLVREGKRGLADRLVRRHIDGVYLALSSGSTVTALGVMAQFYDRHVSLQGPGSGWAALLVDRAEYPDRYAEYDAARLRIVQLLREGRVDEAADADAPEVPEGSPAGPVLRVEAARLRGLALLLAERPSEAARAFEPGITAARAGRPYDAAHLLLFLCEAFRRSGNTKAAAEAWSEGVTLAAGLADRIEDVFDPVFWERAFNLKPRASDWPPPVRDVLLRRGERTAGLPVKLAATDLALWASIGAQRLLRGEHKAALVAFSKSEGPEAAAEFMRIGQARALAALGQVQAARAVLMPLAGAAQGPSVRPAEALLGALEMKVGSIDRALVLLKRAVETPGDEDWAGRAEAEANYGLALLAAGEEKDGLRWLRASQRRFDAARDYDGLLQALRNELRWAKHAGREELAERAIEWLAALEGT